MALNTEEIRELSRLLLKIENPCNGVPQEVFDSLTKVVPFASCELIVKNEKGILLTWRNDKFWRGWHIPGGLMRFNDTFDKRIKKVAKKELGVKIKKHTFLFPMNYVGSNRGHEVSFVFLCNIDSEPIDGKFFKTMPKNIIKGHIKTWNNIKKYKI